MRHGARIEFVFLEAGESTAVGLKAGGMGQAPAKLVVQGLEVKLLPEITKR